MAAWRRSDVEKLIHLYEQKNCLYAVSSPEYHNKSKRSMALQEITHELTSDRPGTTVEEVKSKINGLRTQFMAERSKKLKSHKSGAGTGDLYMPSLWCYKSLQFLERHSNPRRSISNLPSISKEQDISCDLEELMGEAFQIEPQLEIVSVPVEPQLEIVSVPSGSGESLCSTSSSGSLKKLAPTPKRKRVDDAGESIQEFLTKTSSALEIPKYSHCEHFGMYVGHELMSIKNKKLQKKTIKIVEILMSTNEEDGDM